MHVLRTSDDVWPRPKEVYAVATTSSMTDGLPSGPGLRGLGYSHLIYLRIPQVPNFSSTARARLRHPRSFAE